jgi:hypothetical protein
MSQSHNANSFIENELQERLKKVGAEFDADAICLNGPLIGGTDGLLRDAVEVMKVDQNTKRRLVFLLTTDGGYIEVVDRIVDVLRTHYDIVEFVIPDAAYSAGTVLAMSGDEIYMDYFSRLGPIDPQVPSKRVGRNVPGRGYTEKFNDLLKKTTPLSQAEIVLLLNGFDQADLYAIEQARELSITLLEKWLVKYKFKNWTETRTQHIRVTPEMKRARAKKIGEILSDATQWHSHGYGISMERLNSDEVNVIIEDYKTNPSRSRAIGAYHEMLTDYMGKLGMGGTIHFPGTLIPYVGNKDGE